jgi:hypothetical protein
VASIFGLFAFWKRRHSLARLSRCIADGEAAARGCEQAAREFDIHDSLAAGQAWLKRVKALVRADFPDQFDGLERDLKHVPGQPGQRLKGQVAVALACLRGLNRIGRGQAPP